MRERRAWGTVPMIALAAFLVSACSGGSEEPTASASSTVEIDAARIFEGRASIAGTITLPRGSGGGKSIQLTMSGGGAEITQRGSYVALAGTTPGESVPFAIRGLVAGAYTVRARVDQNGDGLLDSPGDLDGHSGGTLEAPVFDPALAKETTIEASGATGVDFALGTIP